MKRWILQVFSGFVVTSFLSAASHAAVLQTVVFAASGSVPASSGSGTLNGSPVAYTTAAVGSGTGQDAAGFTNLNVGWATIPGATIPGETGTSSQTGGTFGETFNGGAGSTETITFGTPVVNPILLGSRTDAGVTYSFLSTGASSLSLLSQVNAQLAGTTLSFTGATNQNTDAFALQINGTFSTLSFLAKEATATSGLGAGPSDAQTFTVAVPEPGSLSILAFGAVPLMARRLRRN